LSNHVILSLQKGVSFVGLAPLATAKVSLWVNQWCSP